MATFPYDQPQTRRHTVSIRSMGSGKNAAMGSPAIAAAISGSFDSAMSWRAKSQGCPVASS
jgi:superoxide dismutase